MKKFLQTIFGAFICVFVMSAAAHACSSNQIDIGNGNCVDTKFTITTTNLTAGDEFKWYMSASGTFYVDCGDGGTLSGTGVIGNTITRINSSEVATYICTYDTAGTKTIRMAGLATGYSGLSAIRFFTDTITYSNRTPTPISAISGSIGSIFPTLGQNSYSTQPLFYGTFMNSYITSIPENLFSGVSGAVGYMFGFTFTGCANLTTIPEGLFSGISGAGDYLFQYTFFRCTSLTTIPERLFSGISGAATRMFSDTFGACGLTSLPENLFSGVYGSADGMFAFTFYDNRTLSGYIPPSLFANVGEDDPAYSTPMMYVVFGQTNLDTACPAGTTQYITGYESRWDGHVSCQKTNPISCSAGTYLPKLYNDCAQCTMNNYCGGGTYSFSTSADQGINACAIGYSSGAGASSCTPNVINITWEDATPESVAANNAGSCTYGGTINTPAVAPTKRGYVFTGWSFDVGNGS